MAVKRCPNPSCRLISPITATVCDCGRSFIDGTMTEHRKYLPGRTPSERNAASNLALALGVGGLIAFVLGRALLPELPAAASLLGTCGFAMALIGWVGFFVNLLRRR